MVNQTTAAAILQRGKQLTPDRFPKPDAATAAAWAKSLRGTYPPALWEEAVHLWAEDLVSDRMATPKEINQAARIVLRRWESDPVRGPQLEAHRQQLTEQRDQELRDGTFGINRGYQPRAVEPPKPEVPDFIKKWTKRNNHKRPK